MTTAGKTLPTRWEEVCLGDMVAVLDSQGVPVNATERAKRTGPTPYYGATGQVGWIDDYLFDEELVLLGEDGAPFLEAGKGVSYLIRGKSWVNNHAHVLRTLGEMPAGFLRYQLNQVNYAPFISGTTRLKLPQAPMRRIPLVIPPLAEQIRIVEGIDSLFSKLDVAVAALERVRANLKRYRASVLTAAVEGRLVPTEAELARKERRDFEPASVLRERLLVERRRRWEESQLAWMKASDKPPKDDRWKSKYKEPVAPGTSSLPQLPEGWCWATIDAVASVVGGVTKGQKRSATEQLRRIPYLRVANVQRGYLDLSVIKEIEATEQEIQELRLQPGDVLFNEGGDRDKLGRGWVWNGEIPECIHQNHVLRARLFTQDLLPKFLSWYGNSAAQLFFVQQGKQTTNLASLNSTNLKKLPVPLPPVAEQARIAAEIELSLSVADATVKVAEAAIARCARLRQSILKWAFEGKLVDQDPNDEPASVFLERIRAERGAATPPRRSREPNTHQVEVAK